MAGGNHDDGRSVDRGAGSLLRREKHQYQIHSYLVQELTIAVLTGLVTVQGQSVMVRVVALVTV